MGIFGNNNHSEPVQDQLSYVPTPQTNQPISINVSQAPIQDQVSNSQTFDTPTNTPQSPDPYSQVQTTQPYNQDQPVNGLPDNSYQNDFNPAYSDNVGAPTNTDQNTQPDGFQNDANQQQYAPAQNFDTPENQNVVQDNENSASPEPQQPTDNNQQDYPADSSSMNTGDAPADLDSIKQQALEQLTPLISHLNHQSPEEQFNTTMMMMQATDDRTLVSRAYEAAQLITDEPTKAQALLDLVNEINYFNKNTN